MIKLKDVVELPEKFFIVEARDISDGMYMECYLPEEVEDIDIEPYLKKWAEDNNYIRLKVQTDEEIDKKIRSSGYIKPSDVELDVEKMIEVMNKVLDEPISMEENLSPDFDDVERLAKAIAEAKPFKEVKC